MPSTRRPTLIALLIALAPLIWPSPATSADANGLGPALDAWARPLVERGLLSGNLLVARRDSVLLERSWGMADAERGIPNASDVPSCVASITKPMTVILAIQLMEEGKLGYGDPLSKWIPDFPLGDSITVEHLLRHRAGIPHRLTEEEDENRPRTAADMVELAKRAPLTHAPGAKSAYSSGGFSVLARVLELAGGARYGELLRRRLLEPLGMSHTYHPDADAPGGPRAEPYVPVLGGVEPAPAKDYSFLVGAGSVFSTPRDLHRLLRADVSGRLGEGARQSALRGATVRWNGSTNGYRAFVEYDTTTGVAIVFAGNLHSGGVDQMSAAVRALLAGETPAPPAEPPARAAPVAPELLRSYEGFYEVAGNPRLAVRATASGLDVNGWALVAMSDSTFFSLRDFATVKAVGGPGGGRIERFDWALGGQVWPCPRVGDLP